MLVVAGSIVLVSRVTDLAPPGASSWPLWLIVPGVAMVIGSFAIPPRGGLGLAIPGAILAMVGVVLWFQAAYNLYATWAYAWALVAPTGPGLGMLFYGLARGDRELARDGLRTTVTGLALFIGFALFFEGVLGLSGQTFPDVRENLPYLRSVWACWRRRCYGPQAERASRSDAPRHAAAGHPAVTLLRAIGADGSYRSPSMGDTGRRRCIDGFMAAMVDTGAATGSTRALPAGIAEPRVAATALSRSRAPCSGSRRPG